MNANEKMFGRVTVEAEGSHTPDRNWLTGPLELPASVMHRFCTGCGLSAEVDDTAAREFATRAGVHFDGPIPKNLYVQTHSCLYCTGEQSKVEIKEIS